MTDRKPIKIRFKTIGRKPRTLYHLNMKHRTIYILNARNPLEERQLVERALTMFYSQDEDMIDYKNYGASCDDRTWGLSCEDYYGLD